METFNRAEFIAKCEKLKKEFEALETARQLRHALDQLETDLGR